MKHRANLLSLIPLAFGLLVLGLCAMSVYVRWHDMPRIELPGQRTVNLGVGEYFVYGDVHCNVKDDRGVLLDLKPHHEPHWFSFPRPTPSTQQMWVTRPGDYAFVCAGEGGTRGKAAIGRDLGVTVLIGVVAFVVSFLAAIVMLVIIQRRRRTP